MTAMIVNITTIVTKKKYSQQIAKNLSIKKTDSRTWTEMSLNYSYKKTKEVDIMNTIRKLLDLGIGLTVAPSEFRGCAKVLASSSTKMQQRLKEIQKTYPNASIIKIEEEFGMGFYTIELGDEDNMKDKVKNEIKKYLNVEIISITESSAKIEFELYDYLDKPGNFEEDIECIMHAIQPLIPTSYTVSHKYCNDEYWDGEEMTESNLSCTITIKEINEVITMDITKMKDNQIVKDDGYVDSELLRDNFDGSEEHLKIIAKTVYECVDATNEDDFTFMDECESMVDYDYDYLKIDQQHDVLKLVDELCCNGGKFKGEL